MAEGGLTGSGKAKKEEENAIKKEGGQRRRERGRDVQKGREPL